jgi:hypothetical protein
MPDDPKTANTQELADMEYDAERWAQVGAERSAGVKNAAETEGKPDVGPSQKETDENAIQKRETDV